MLVKFQGNANPADTVRVLTGWTLSFTCPSEFNDPFECYPGFIKVREANLLQALQLREAQKDLLRQLAISAGGTSTSVSASSISDEQLASLGPNLFGVFCAAELSSVLTPEAHLMWAHYANSHTGIALALNRNHAIFKSAEGRDSSCLSWSRSVQDVSGRSWHLGPASRNLAGESDGFLPVRYTTHRPTAPRGGCVSNIPMITEALLQKSRVWAYEQEWRCLKRLDVTGPGRIRPTNGSRLLVSADETLVSAVYIGAKASSDTIDAVMAAVASTRTGLRVYKLRMDNTSFQLEAAQLTGPKLSHAIL